MKKNIIQKLQIGTLKGTILKLIFYFKNIKFSKVMSIQTTQRLQYLLVLSLIKKKLYQFMQHRA